MGIFTIPTPAPLPSPSSIESDGGRWIRLNPPSNRLIEYFIYGSSNDDATLLIDCPGGGTTGSLIGKLPGVTEWCLQYNIRILSPSYPGFGRSEVKKGWTIGEWPKTDLEPILEQEGIGSDVSFFVSGTSFGSPHAQAIAAHFGSDRVKALGLRVPYIGRAVSEEVGLPLGQANMHYTSVSANTTPWGHLLGKGLMATCANPGSFFDEPSGMQRAFINCLQPKALETIAKMNEEHKDAMAVIKEDMSRGVVISGQGWLYMCATDTLLDHEFDVRDIKNVPVVIWYAADDEDCPPSHAEWLVATLGVKEPRVFSGLGHVGAAFVDHVEFLEQVRKAVI